MSFPVSRWLLEDAVLIQQSAGSYNADDEWEPGAEARTDIEVTASPANAGAWRHVLTEGVRLSDYREFIFEAERGTISPVRVGTGQTQADVIEYRDIRYIARDVGDWEPDGFVRVLGVRREGQGGLA